MTNIKFLKRNNSLFLVALFAVSAGFSSCNKYKEITPASYPDQTIYMPAANAFYEINSIIPVNTNSVPTPGQPFKYTIDLTKREFTVPLSVVRGGLNNNDEFNVDVMANTDTISKLVTGGQLSNVTVLSADKYSVPAVVTMSKGKEYAPINITIKLDSLRNNAGKRFAVGISISSKDKMSNPKLSTTILIIDAKIIKPVADFSIKADVTNIKKILFTNVSASSVSYSWNFGDGSAISTEQSPAHVFPAAGTYTVTLTSIGITGADDKSTKSIAVKVL